MSFKWLLIFVFTVLTGCGEQPTAGLPVFPPGITSELGPVNQQTIDKLAGDFYDMQDCHNIFLGAFEELQIELVDGLFDCPGAILGKCSAFFQPPNRMKLGFLGEAKEEYFHYLVFLRDGDPDPRHSDARYLACK